MLKTLTIVIFALCSFCHVYAQISVSDTAKTKKIILLPPTQLRFANQSPLVLPQNFTVKNLPFFCDKEYKLEKATKIPFRFRLGSVEYCDKLEGKNK